MKPRTTTAICFSIFVALLAPGVCRAQSEGFETLPAWTSTWDAAWGSVATFSVQPGGQTGNFLQSVRSSAGSSSRVLVYNVPSSTNLTISIYMRCPSGSTYWMETGYRLGSFTAENFDQSPDSWTLVKKFDGFGSFENGNNNTWTQYSAQVNSGAFTQISIGFKHGANPGTGPTVGWDQLVISGGAVPTSTPTNTVAGPTATPTNTLAGPTSTPTNTSPPAGNEDLLDAAYPGGVAQGWASWAESGGAAAPTPSRGTDLVPDADTVGEHVYQRYSWTEQFWTHGGTYRTFTGLAPSTVHNVKGHIRAIQAAGGIWWIELHAAGGVPADFSEDTPANQLGKISDAGGGTPDTGWLQFTGNVTSDAQGRITVWTKVGNYGDEGAFAFGLDWILGLGETAATATPTNTPGGPTATPTNTSSGCVSDSRLDGCYQSGVDANWQSWSETGGAAPVTFARGTDLVPDADGVGENVYQRYSWTGQTWSHGGTYRTYTGLVPNTLYPVAGSIRMVSAAGGVYWVELFAYSGVPANFAVPPGAAVMLGKLQDGVAPAPDTGWQRYSANITSDAQGRITVWTKSGNFGLDGTFASALDWVVVGTEEEPTATPTNTIPGPTNTPTNTSIAGPDIDSDSIVDSIEGQPPAAGQSNRWLRDSDGDGLDDGTEDANRNGAQDAGETATRNYDSDGDRYEDGLEVLNGTNPLDPASPATAFVDGDNDRWPALYDSNDGNKDQDLDKFLDGYEVQHVGAAAVTDNAVFPDLGDLNLDNQLSNLDALLIQSLFLGTIEASHPIFQGSGFSNGDANRDGLFSNLDALVVQAVFLSVFDHLPL